MKALSLVMIAVECVVTLCTSVCGGWGCVGCVWVCGCGCVGVHICVHVCACVCVHASNHCIHPSLLLRY